MSSSTPSLPDTPRPDLQDFISALSGFLGEQSTPLNETHLRFLSMFCRSVGATDGHFLEINEHGSMASVVTMGLKDEFNKDFNFAHVKNASKHPCPLDESFQKREVVAVVDVSKAENIPPWFMTLLKKYKFESLVTVPILTDDRVIGLVCAYYRDVCLFDQNTIGHLKVVGRMMGTATASQPPAPISFDELLSTLTTKTLNQAQFFEHIGKAAQQLKFLDAFMSGPVRKTSSGYSFTVVDGFGIPDKIISHRIAIPPAMIRNMARELDNEELPHVTKRTWEDLFNLIEDDDLVAFYCPLIINKKLEGFNVGFSKEAMPNKERQAQFSRLSKIALLGLISILKS